MRRFVFVFFLLIAFGSFSQETKRIVSLAPSVTDNIYLIGGAKKLVGCTSYCYPAIKDSVTQVGSAVDVNVEKVFALQPDIVFTTRLTKPQDIASLRQLGIKVEVLETPRSFQQICDQTIHIAELIGETGKAGEIVEGAERKVAEIKRKSKELRKQKVFFQIGANPIFTVIKNTFLDDYITFCHAENITADLTSGTITREAVVAQNPDVIIIAEMGGFGAEEERVWKSYQNLSAAKSNKVFLISSDTSCNPTPTNFVSALNDVYNFIKE